ncbi:MAG: helix-turn-helix domain-containing protein, partial [Novosphingobium sp.]
AAMRRDSCYVLFMPGAVMMNIRARARASAAGDRAALAASPTPALTPRMASRKQQALVFVQEYIAQCNGAPSLSEIAAGLGVGKARASYLVDALVDAGELRRLPGPRGLVLPCAIERARELLRAAGVLLIEEAPGASAGPKVPCTKTGLSALLALDYDPVRDSAGSSDDGSEAADGEGRGRTSARAGAGGG